MTSTTDETTILYEVNLEADAASEAPFDTWLRDHIADLLQVPGFLSAEILGDASADAGTVRRTVQYRLRDRAALDDFLATEAGRLEAAGAGFGARYRTGHRTLVHREEFLRGAVSTANCLNCGEVLSGQHCAHCGQRARIRVLSLWSLLREVLGDTFDWDSRLWRTLRPLAFRPGLLTLEFLRGRRTRYTPPFRMYLILSVVFFLLASFDSGLAVRIDGDNAYIALDDGSEAAADAAAAVATTPAPPLDAEHQQLLDSIVAKLPEQDRERALPGLRDRIATLDSSELEQARKVAADPCSAEAAQIQLGPWGERYVPRIRDACRKIVADSQGFGRAVFQNVPRTMFAFLPLIALLMQLLYPGSGRFYVEHLLFFVHYHAFFFLGGLVILLLERGGAALAGTGAAPALLAASGACTAGFVIYAPLYLYLAMRRVYGQGFMLTFAKYLLLVIGYLTGLVLTIVGLLLYTALAL